MGIIIRILKKKAGPELTCITLKLTTANPDQATNPLLLRKPKRMVVK